MKLHPDWEVLSDGTLFNRFTMEVKHCSTPQRKYLEALDKRGYGDHNTELASDELAALKESGIVTDAEEPTSRLSSYSNRADETDEININRLRFFVTERCNMGCPGCFVRFKYRNDEDFENADHSQARQAVDFLRERNKGDSFEIHFLGGEPLIVMDLIKETVSYAEEVCNETEPSFSVTTNATIVTEDIAEYLDEKDFTVGVSFDGWEELNDESRVYMNGDGTYEDAVNGYRILQDTLSQGVGVLVTPQPLNIDHLADIVDHLLTDLSPDGITINDPFHSNGIWEISGRRFADKLKEILLLCEESQTPIISPASQIIKAIANDQPKLQTLPSSDRDMSAALSIDGRISFHIMNYEEELFPTAIDDPPFDEFEQWATFSGYQHEACRDCIALNTCSGPDPIESYQRTGNVEEIKLNPERCVFYKHMTRWLLKQGLGTISA